MERPPSPRRDTTDPAKPQKPPVPIPDLVRDSRLTTHFLPGGGTQHTVHRVPHQSRVGRPSRINETWDRQQELGRGAFGCVWLEKCGSGPAEGRLRAVKEMRKDPSTAVPYSRELEAMAKFSHERYVHCFVECYGWYESENLVFIAMEYIKYGDLQSYLDRPFSEAHTKAIGSQLVEGLEYMHENGFAHRDLKPKNILVCQGSPDWWVKIGDFGISKRAEEATALRTVIGTNGYIAPEVLGFVPDQRRSSSDAFSYTFAVDMWALGELLFRMIVQRPVFQNQLDLYNYVFNKRSFPVPVLEATGASQDCCSFVTGCMAGDPDCRLKASEASAHPWLQISRQSSNPVPARIDSIPTTSILPSRGRQAPLPIPADPQPMVDAEYSAEWTTATKEPQQTQDRSSTIVPINPTHKGRWTPLHSASQKGDVKAVQALLEKGADITARTYNGWTPLDLASQEGQTAVVRFLLEKGADVMAVDNDGLTPLHWASRKGHANAVQVLLEKGADVMAVDRFGWTPLHRASFYGYAEVIQELMKKGADITAVTNTGRTPLHWPSQEGHIEVARLLLEKGADFTAADDDGWTPLALASYFGHNKVVQALRGREAPGWHKAWKKAQDKMNLFKSGHRSKEINISARRMRRGEALSRPRS